MQLNAECLNVINTLVKQLGYGFQVPNDSILLTFGLHFPRAWFVMQVFEPMVTKIVAARQRDHSPVFIRYFKMGTITYLFQIAFALSLPLIFLDRLCSCGDLPPPPLPS